MSSPAAATVRLASTSYQGGKINLEDITPEVASYVVKNYLLPMFENDIRKGQRSKRQGDYGNQQTENTVYGELKLSEKLQLEIYTLREERDNLREQIERLSLDNQNLQKQVKDQAIKANKSKVAQQNLISRISKLEQERQGLIHSLEKESHHNKEYLSLITVSESYRKEFGSCYQNEKIINEVTTGT